MTRLSTNNISLLDQDINMNPQNFTQTNLPTDNKHVVFWFCDKDVFMVNSHRHKVVQTDIRSGRSFEKSTC